MVLFSFLILGTFHLLLCNDNLLSSGGEDTTRTQQNKCSWISYVLPQT